MAAKSGTQEQKLKTKIANDGGALAYNVVAKHEAMHLTRRLMMEAALQAGELQVSQRVKTLIQHLANEGREHDLLKELCNSGYASMFREVMGENGERLKVEVDKILHGCTYRDTKSINPDLLKWDRVFHLMATYGLDSCDAMIVNLAVSDKTFAGIVAVDKDYRLCGDVQDGFDVILPDGAVNTVMSREWRQAP